MDPKSSIFYWLILILGCLLIYGGLWISSDRIISSEGVVRGKTMAVELPWRFKHSGNNNRLKLELESTFFSPKVWQIIPDDQLKSIDIDGQRVSLSEVPPAALTDYSNGFKLDLSSHLTPGPHTVEIRFNNRGGDGGLNIKPVPGVWRYLPIYFGLLLITLCMAKCFSLKPGQKWVLGLALIPIVFYWSATPWDMRAHDVSGGGHYNYIEYVATKKSFPLPSEGWVFYHPPTYYLAGAAVWHLAKIIEVPIPQALQLLSIFFWLVFLVSSLATVNIFLKRKPVVRLLASFAIACWPAGILHSPAIGNDSALYACIGMAVWFMCRWWYGSRRRDLLYMALFCSLSVLVKSNGIVVVAAAGILLLLRFLLRRKGKKMRAFFDGLLFASIAATALFASLAVRIYNFIKGDSPSWVIGNLGNLHSGLRVPADIKAFIPIDVPTLLTQPYVSPWSDETGRGSFWIFLLRSSLSGEFSFPDPSLTKIAYLWGALLLLLFFSLICGLPRLWRTGIVVLYRHLPLLLLGLLWIASLIYLRIQIPYSCSNDFRYVLPILLPVVLFWVTQGNWSRMGLMMMALSSAAFYVGVGLV